MAAIGVDGACKNDDGENDVGENDDCEKDDDEMRCRGKQSAREMEGNQTSNPQS